jgi:hypothetical protein
VENVREAGFPTLPRSSTRPIDCATSSPKPGRQMLRMSAITECMPHARFAV